MSRDDEDARTMGFRSSEEVAKFQREQIMTNPTPPLSERDRRTLTDADIEAWADAFILKAAFNRPIAIQIAQKAAQWVRDHYEAAAPQPPSSPATEQREGEPTGYSGVRCMCLQTGCRAGPGCPHYCAHCKAHIAALAAMKETR